MYREYFESLVPTNRKEARSHTLGHSGSSKHRDILKEKMKKKIAKGSRKKNRGR